MKLRFFFLIIISFFISGRPVQAFQYQSEEYMEAALRMIGHKVLLASGDSNSRVLPIRKVDEKYRIQFDTDFQFKPEDLVADINSVMNEKELSTNYIVEVEACDSGILVYSFAMNKNEHLSIVPCQSRDIPLGCYELLISVENNNNDETAFYMKENSSIEIPKRAKSTLQYSLFIIPFLLIIGLWWYWKRREKQALDQGIIALGKFQFDTRNEELLLNNQKIELTGKESELLLLLYNEANTTVEKEQILNKVWGDEGDYIGRTLDVFISKLRKKLESDDALKIINIRGVGYKLVVND